MTADAPGAGHRFSVIIVNYNGGAMLRECVQSVIAEAVPASQIVIIDNGSADRSIEEVQRIFPGLTIIRNVCNAGFARAVNQGLRLATAEFALLLNNDARLEPGALLAFTEGFDTLPKLAIAGGQLRYPDGRLQSAFAPLPSLPEEALPRALLSLVSPHRFRRKTPEDSPIAVESVLGACLCARVSMLPRFGFLDEDYFFFFEEIEWCQRARRLGFDVYYLPAARAIHGQGQTADRFRGPSRVEHQRSKLTFFRKTRKPSEYFWVSIVLVIRTTVNALAGAVACIATLFWNRRLRTRAGTYWYLLGWHALLRPASWGLPGKCPVDNRGTRGMPDGGK